MKKQAVYTLLYDNENDSMTQERKVMLGNYKMSNQLD